MRLPRIVILGVAVSCLAVASLFWLTHSIESVAQPTPPTQTSGVPLEANKLQDSRQSTTSKADAAAERIIYEFAEYMTQGDCSKAVGLLGPTLRSMFSANDCAGVRNTPRMEIVKVVDHTGDWPPNFGGRTATAEKYAVFYVEARYKVLGIIPSYFVDGEIYYHKVTVAILTGSQGWVITELGTSRTRE